MTPSGAYGPRPGLGESWPFGSIFFELGTTVEPAVWMHPKAETTTRNIVKHVKQHEEQVTLGKQMGKGPRNGTDSCTSTLVKHVKQHKQQVTLVKHAKQHKCTLMQDGNWTQEGY